MSSLHSPSLFYVTHRIGFIHPFLQFHFTVWNQIGSVCSSIWLTVCCSISLSLSISTPSVNSHTDPISSSRSLTSSDHLFFFLICPHTFFSVITERFHWCPQIISHIIVSQHLPLPVRVVVYHFCVGEYLWFNSTTLCEILYVTF